MEQKTVYTSKDIEQAFAIPNREQIYWVDRGYLEPDVQRERPRVFSSTQAVSAGFMRFFQNEGYLLERAARLSKIAASVSLYALQSRQQLPFEPESRLVIRNGNSGVAEIIFKSGEGVVAARVYFHFGTSPEIADRNKLLAADGDKPESLCTFNIDAVARRLCSALGLDIDSFSDFPQDPLVKIELTEDTERSLIGLEGDSYLSAEPGA